MRNYGNYSKPILLFEVYEEWRDDRLAKIDGGLLEAETKADFAEFLFGMVTTAMWGGYNRVQPQYRRYARIESLSDFRARRLRGLNQVRGIGYVGDYGEYPEMRRTERPAANLAVDTYGGVLAITRQAIRNDESGELLNRVPGDMGRATGIFVTRTMIALVESNPTAPDGNPFFSVGRGNQVTAPLSEASLAAAIDFLASQIDDDGDPIIVDVGTLAVKSVVLQLQARRIINSQLTGTTINDPAAAAFDKGNMNPLNGIIPNDAVVRDPFWSDSNDWYVFAAVGDVPAFAIGFLDGNETPFIGLKNPEVRNALGAGQDPYTYEFDTVDFKLRHDFGVAAVDPRGAYRAVVP